jgi:hypothetical protein
MGGVEACEGWRGLLETVASKAGLVLSVERWRWGRLVGWYDAGGG